MNMLIQFHFITHSITMRTIASSSNALFSWSLPYRPAINRRRKFMLFFLSRGVIKDDRQDFLPAHALLRRERDNRNLFGQEQRLYETAAKKIQQYFAPVSLEYDYDEECDYTCLYMNL